VGESTSGPAQKGARSGYSPQLDHASSAAPKAAAAIALGSIPERAILLEVVAIPSGQEMLGTVPVPG
jgi:hypothetical protein